MWIEITNSLQLIIQETWNHHEIIISYDFGWSGSVQDSLVFKEPHLWQNRGSYFKPVEFLLVDRGIFLAFILENKIDSECVGYLPIMFSIQLFNDYTLTSNTVESRYQN